MANNDQLDDDLVRKRHLYAKRAAIINGLLSCVGVCMAVYVYLNHPHPDQIVHTGFDKFGRPIAPESVEEYLFVFPAFQIWCFILPLLSAWGPWRNCIEQSMSPQTSSRWRRSAQDTLILYQFTYGGVVAAGLLIFVAAVCRSLVPAMKFV